MNAVCSANTPAPDSALPATPVSGRRWLYAGLGVALLFFQGLIYAWSVFMPPLEAEFGWSRSETSLAFSICLSMFCLGGLGAGMLSRRRPPGFAVLLASLCMGAGFGLAARAESLPVLYLGYGGLAGFGVGMSYNAILSTMLKWFPDKPGLVSGIMLMGFGAGALLLGPACSRLEAAFGWRAVFSGLGLFYFALYCLASRLVAAPPEGLAFPRPRAAKSGFRESGGEVSTGQMVRRRSFRLYFAWAASMGAAGYILIGHAVPLAASLGVSPAGAAFLAGIISMFNGLGRILGGLSYDAFGRKVLMRAASAGYILCALLIYLCLRYPSPPLLFAGFALTGFCFGCGITAHAAVTGAFYGLRNYSLNFSIITFNTVIAAFLGPYVTGLFHNLQGSYAAAPFCMLGLGLLALLLAVTLKKP